MSKAPPWYKRNPNDWQKGTRSVGMSLELRAFYSEGLDAQWELQGQLPKDEKTLAMMLGTNARKVRALLPRLLSLGKLIETEIGYYNPRMMADILGVDQVEQVGEFAPISKSTEGPIEIEPTSIGDRTDAQSMSEIKKNPEKTTRDLERDSEGEEERESNSKRSYSLPPMPCDPKELMPKLVAAANGAIADPAKFPALMHPGTPIMWLEQGCDLDRDILPTIARIGSNKHDGSIGTWDYYTKPIAEAKLKRERGLPTVTLPSQKPFKISRWGIQ